MRRTLWHPSDTSALVLDPYFFLLHFYNKKNGKRFNNVILPNNRLFRVLRFIVIYIILLLTH